MRTIGYLILTACYVALACALWYVVAARGHRGEW